MPWGASKWWGGWNLSGITTLQSGRSLTLYTGTNNRSGTDNNRPYDIPGTIIRDYPSSTTLVLAPGVTAAALTPPPGQLGTIGRNTEKTDSLLSWNASVKKIIPLTERARIELRGEVFNLFNTTNFDTVDTVLISPSFGKALTAFDPRTAQLALRIEF